jgi:hypothetical protein
MNRKLIVFLTYLIGLSLASMVFAKGPIGESGSKKLYRSNAEGQLLTASNLSNWEYWVHNDGKSAHTPEDNSGGIYPRGTAATIYQDGFVWGGIVRDTRNATAPKMRVGGQTYRIGTTPGHIVTAGTASTPPVGSNANDAYIYRVRTDYASVGLGEASLINDAAAINRVTSADVTESMQQGVLDQYAYDWNNWPGDIGAPYNDVNGNGRWDAGVDEPGIAGADQIIWFVVNDLDEGTTTNLYGSPPIGLELQVTMWSYNQPGATLGQILFKRYKLINKSGLKIDSMFVAQWSDPDVGTYTDDLVASDVARSLGIAYSGNLTDGDYEAFGLPPAAVGYDFFQGPIVASAGDTALFGFKERPGFKNLPMTAFGYFAAGSAISDPALGNYDGTMEWYNLLNGYIPNVDTTNPSPFLAGFGPNAGQPTFFPVDGDPVKQTGDIDGFGSNLVPGDRRMSLSSGPFTMLPGDTQEVVVAIVGGIVAQQGGNNRNAVAQVKLNDDFAQFIFNNRFEGIPTPPASPDVKVTPQEDVITMEWGSNQTRLALTEAKDPLLGFNFEGYNIYQLPNASSTKSQALLVATYDLNNGITQINADQFVPEFGDIVNVPVRFGTNSGIQRFFNIERDFIKGTPLYAGNRYYFAVTAYNAKDSDGDGLIDSDVPEASLESALEIITIVPQSAKPGVVYQGEVGEVLSYSNIGAESDGVVQAKVVSVSALTGDTYEVYFSADPANADELLWNVRNVTTNQILISAQPQASAPDAPDISRPIAEGIEWIVTGPALAYKSFQVVANGAGAVDPPEMGAFAFNNNGFPTLDGSDRPDGARQQVNGSTWGFSAGSGGSSSYDYFVSRTTRAGGNWPQIVPFDFEMRFTAAGGKGEMAFSTGSIVDVPFELWHVGIGTYDDASDDYRMIPLVFDEDGNDLFNLMAIDHSVSGGDNDPYTDWVYWYTPTDVTPGSVGYDAWVNSGFDGNLVDTEVMARTVLVNWNGGSVADATFPANVDAVMPEEGTVFRIVSSKPNQAETVFQLEAPGVLNTTEQAKKDVEKINVFPNPYYAYNPEETNRFNRFVTFTHLPQNATLRIFSLSGVQVRKLEKNNESQFLQWDLQNESTLPVASGVYVVHIDMPDLGMQKVIKVFVVQGAEILDYF